MLREFVFSVVILCIGANPSCPKSKDGMINVHLVCHTHDDVGWLKTVDEYYYGAKKEITPVGVQYILDSVVDSLKKDKSRKFIYVESAFFYRWWDEQTEPTKTLVKKFIKSGQIEFIGGGWSMNDEACPVYSDIIDQMTFGIRKLNETFGPEALPRIAWQIDPFGHSFTQGKLFAEMGFDGLFLGRIDYADKDRRWLDKQMEMVWKPKGDWNPDLTSEGSVDQIFTGILPNTYSPPEGFCFDVYCADDPIMDDERLEEYNVDEKVDLFLKRVKDQSEGFATSSLIMTMGMDFHYVYAESWYKNLDKLIKYVNERQFNGSKVNIMYSTPSCYLDALNEAKQTWTIKTDDFFPYSSDPHAYWTGYFASRPALKWYIRYAYPFLQAAKQLSVLIGESDPSVEKLSRAMGVTQHHDAVTGTAKQTVTDDYNKRLSDGISAVQDYLSRSLSKFSENGRKLEFCNRLNISECSFTENNDNFIVSAYNPTGHAQKILIQMPISNCHTYKVVNKQGSEMKIQLMPISKGIKSVPGRNSTAVCDLFFRTEEIPPLSTLEYYVSKISSRRYKNKMKSLKKDENGETVVLDNKIFQIIIDKDGSKIYKDKNSSDFLSCQTNFQMYYAMAGNNSNFDNRASGAYIFRPNGSAVILDGYKMTLKVEGDLFTEYRYESEKYPWLSFAERYHHEEGWLYFEIIWLAGPIPIGDGIGKEIIFRGNILDASPTFSESEDFYTDSNGREYIKRIRNHRYTWNLTSTEPISQNYYPAASGMVLKKKNGPSLAIMNDRTQGAASLQDGQMEMMIHRRLLHDDGFGVDEALNETAYGEGLVVAGKHTVAMNFISPTNNYTSSVFRRISQATRLPPIVSFSKSPESLSEWRKSSQFPIKINELPENIHLLSLEPWSHGRILLRLEHLYDQFQHQPREIPSSPATSINVKTIFEGWNILKIEELDLATAHVKKNKEALTWNESPHRKDKRRELMEETYGIYFFEPYQIRTFLLTIN